MGSILAILEPILSWICIIALGGWIVYAGLIKPVVNPTPTSTQSGGTSYNYSIKLGLGSCARIPSPQEQISTAVKPIIGKAKAVVK